MNEVYFNNFINKQATIFARAQEVLDEINRIEPIRRFKFLEPISVSDDHVIFQGTEYAYMEAEHCEYHLEVKYLYDDSPFLAEYLKSIKLKKEKKRLALVSEYNEREYLKELEEEKEYLRLKRKFESKH